MICDQCQQDLRPDARFCDACGAALGTGNSDGNWQRSTDFHTVISHPEVQALIDAATGTQPGGMSGEQFIRIAQPIMRLSGSGPVPLQLTSDIARKLTSRIGMKVSKTIRQGFRYPPGRTLAAVLCSLASRNQTLSAGEQAEDGCVLRAVMPSSMTSYEGEIIVTLAQHAKGTMVTAAATVRGQLIDWGKSRRTLSALIADVPEFIRMQPESNTG